MGKIQRTKIGAKPASNGGAATPQYTVSDLLSQAQQAVDRFEFELALQFAVRALQLDNKSVPALDAAGSIEMELQLYNEAKEVRKRGNKPIPQGWDNAKLER